MREMDDTPQRRFDSPALPASLPFTQADSTAEELCLLGQDARDMEGIFQSYATIDTFADERLIEPGRIDLLVVRQRNVQATAHLATSAQEFERAAVGVT
jgi:hypothetical protein